MSANSPAARVEIHKFRILEAIAKAFQI
jgi:hypothetical protein